MRIKTAALVFMAAIAGLAVFAPRKNAPPPDLRDAVASRELDTRIPEIGDDYGSIPVPKAAAPSETAAQPVREWTVMVYMNGMNNLYTSGFEQLNAMEKAGSDERLNIVAEFGSLGDCPRVCSRRYLVTKDEDRNKLRSKELRRFKKVDMGDWRHLAEFAKWAKASYPARHYALIIWNHGSGWLTTKAAGPNKGLSYDDETQNHISTPELGYAMKEIGRVDILAFDACLMQMAEVLYEVRDYADYVVGSEENNWSYPYTEVMRAFARPGVGASELTSFMVSAYGEEHRDWLRKVTLSAVKVSELNSFLAVFDDWTRALLASDKKPEIKKSANSAASYANKDNKDLYDFARLLSEAFSGEEVGVKSKALMDSLAGGLVTSSIAFTKNGDPDGTAHGLAIYLPNSGYNGKYDALAWARGTKWDEFLKEMTGVSVAGSDPCVRPGDGATSADWQAFAACLVR